MSPFEPLDTPLARRVWETKYRYRGEELTGTWRRVARALAAAEPRDAARWEEEFYRALEGFRFIPGGRILAGAGTDRKVTLFNCFVMGLIDDSMDGIFDALKEGALTMQQGGGVGYDFSTLRPRGAAARATGTHASGPVSFMHIWDAMCATILSTGVRRGAMMATLRCDHPDILEFVDAKRTRGRLTHFNLSVQVTDAFMEAVRADRDWPLVFPAAQLGGGEGALIERRWTGSAGPVACRVLRVLRARDLWERILRAAWESAEPGVLFVDRINQLNNLAYREYLTATNPCGEIPLPPYGACDLGAINLTRFVREPFSPAARLELKEIGRVATVAARMLDDVIDVSGFPLPAQAAVARGTRRVGLGLTGLGDALIMLGLHYGSPAAREVAASAMRTIRDAAYRASVAAAREKGPFPFLDRERYLQAPFVRALPEDVRRGIEVHGIRNSHLTALAPTGTISLLAGNVSSGIEPVFAFRATRKVLEADGSLSEHAVLDHALRLWEARGGGPLPATFVEARALTPEDHLQMQAALQPYVDNAISKTIQVPESCALADFERLYDLAYDRGLKGCTAYRPTAVRGEVVAPAEAAAPCCTLEREGE